jgi:membrane dipeptidase
LIIGHHDALLRLEQEDDHEPFLYGSDWSQIDLPRSQDAGVSASFFACWVPQPSTSLDDLWEDFGEESDDVVLDDPIDPDYARDFVDSMVLRLHELAQASEGELVVVYDLQDLRRCRELGQHGAILHFEGAEPLSGDPGWLEYYYSWGLRSLGLVWSRSNEFATGVPFRFPSSPDTGPGLSEAGFQLVAACNELGVIIDLSHLNEEGFWDVARSSKHPLVASHSNAHALCPSARNLTDAQLLAVRDSGGIVGVNFCTSDLRDDGQDDEDTDVDLVVEQVLYMVEVMGIEHVGLGTDFDGAMVPAGLGDVTCLPDLLEALRERGLEPEQLELLAYGNWERVMAATWQD